MAEPMSEFPVRGSHNPGAPRLSSKTGSTSETRPAEPIESGAYPYDVCIAGGGPAGLACAIAAALRGLRVQVIDGMRPPIDKACGEGLMPDTLAALARLGIRM